MSGWEPGVPLYERPDPTSQYMETIFGERAADGVTDQYVRPMFQVIDDGHPVGRRDCTFCAASDVVVIEP